MECVHSYVWVDLVCEMPIHLQLTLGHGGQRVSKKGSWPSPLCPCSWPFPWPRFPASSARDCDMASKYTTIDYHNHHSPQGFKFCSRDGFRGRSWRPLLPSCTGARGFQRRLFCGAGCISGCLHLLQPSGFCPGDGGSIVGHPSFEHRRLLANKP